MFINFLGRHSLSTRMRRVSGYILDPLLDKLENSISFANIGQYHCRVLNFNFSYSIELISTQKTWFHFSHKNIKSHLTHPHFWPQFCMFHMNTVLSFKRIKYAVWSKFLSLTCKSHGHVPILNIYTAFPILRNNSASI